MKPSELDTILRAANMLAGGEGDVIAVQLDEDTPGAVGAHNALVMGVQQTIIRGEGALPKGGMFFALCPSLLTISLPLVPGVAAVELHSVLQWIVATYEPVCVGVACSTLNPMKLDLAKVVLKDDDPEPVAVVATLAPDGSHRTQLIDKSGTRVRDCPFVGGDTYLLAVLGDLKWPEHND